MKVGLHNTTVRADTYLQHQPKNLSNKTTDPLAEILNIINNNPALYTIELVTTTSKTCDQYEEQNGTNMVQKEADIEQYHKKAADSQEKGIINIHAKSDPVQENKVNRTRSGCVVKKHITTVRAQSACLLPLKSHMADQVIFKF